MNTRNFAVVAHVDHGKSTLADRFLEICHTVAKEKMQEQLLDSLSLERERGITIKLAPVRLKYELEGVEYTLNMIDTPGHVDFSYEVSRSLAAVEGAVLLVDATQGIQAQTLAHGLSAMEANLVLVPVVNKIDLPNADIDAARKQLMNTFGFREDEIILASGKTGEGVEEILEAVIKRVPPPKDDPSTGSAGSPQARSGLRPLRALVFDSFFDSYKGVVAEVRVVEGSVGDLQSKIYLLGSRAEGEVLEKGYFDPKLHPSGELVSGEIGYIATGIKQANTVRVGDTISDDPAAAPLPGYRQVKPMVFVGLYPVDSSEYFDLKEALAKFKLNDPAFSYEMETSGALGSGFRCGFLGLLHAEVVQERLQEEFGVDLLATSPSVEYRAGEKVINNPSELLPSDIKILEEPWVSLKIYVRQSYVGGVMELVQERRGVFKDMHHFGAVVELSYEMPLSEEIADFYDKLKSVSSGFASLDWEMLDYRLVDGVRVDILVGGEKVDALANIVYKPKAREVGRRIVERLKQVLPRQNFAIALQAAIGGEVIARETISPFRKDVTAKLYGGDRTRKDKLLEKQKKGKKKMKMIGRVEIPQEAFLSILKS